MEYIYIYLWQTWMTFKLICYFIDCMAILFKHIVEYILCVYFRSSWQNSYSLATPCTYSQAYCSGFQILWIMLGHDICPKITTRMTQDSISSFRGKVKRTYFSLPQGCLSQSPSLAGITIIYLWQTCNPGYKAYHGSQIGFELLSHVGLIQQLHCLAKTQQLKYNNNTSRLYLLFAETAWSLMLIVLSDNYGKVIDLCVELFDIESFQL